MRSRGHCQERVQINLGKNKSFRQVAEGFRPICSPGEKMVRPQVEWFSVPDALGPDLVNS